MNYIRKFPEGHPAVLAQTRLDEVRKVNRETENSLYAKALETDMPQLWDQYLKKFSGGRFDKEAMEKRAASVRRVEEDNLYQNSAKSDTVPAWEAYLTKFPDVPRSANARTRIQQLIWSKFADIAPIPGGSFMMGSSSDKGDEKPPHKVELEAFHMGKTEVTNAQFAKFLQETGRHAPAPPSFDAICLASKPDLPVLNVTYADAEAFCKWLGDKIGKPARLPTEAEW